MPKATRIILHALNAVGLKFISLLVKLCGFVILNNFHVGPPNRSQHPPSVEMILRQLFKLFNRLFAIIHTEVVVSVSKFFQERHQAFIKTLVLELSDEWRLFFLFGSWFWVTLLLFYYSSFLFFETGVEIIFLELTSKLFILSSLNILFGITLSPSLPSFS